jgi:hypothetical protein
MELSNSRYSKQVIASGNGLLSFNSILIVMLALCRSKGQSLRPQKSKNGGAGVQRDLKMGKIPYKLSDFGADAATTNFFFLFCLRCGKNMKV